MTPWSHSAQRPCPSWLTSSVGISSIIASGWRKVRVGVMVER